jgi:DMSO/TMAO reductase YedYZ molybdopterin-dependent catalytic subunit
VRLTLAHHDRAERPAASARWGLPLAALAGLLAAGAGIGVAELVAALVDPASSPVVAVGSAAIDATPVWLKDVAIRRFGSADKTVLLSGVGAVLALLAAAAGVLQRRRPPAGLVLVVLFGGLGLAAALTRPVASWLYALPSLAAALVAGAALVRLSPAAEPAPAGGTGRGRRSVLRTGLLVAAVGIAGGVGGRAVGARRFSVAGSRARVRLPLPARPVVRKAGVQVSTPGMTPFETPVGDFYRVDTALVVPQLPAERWRLRVHGMVGTEARLDYAALLERGLVERDITLTCVSNEVGGRYAGSGRWLGVPLADLLREAGVDPRADQLLCTSVDGMTIGTSLAAVLDGRDALLAVGLNGEPLTAERGFPVRMVVPGLYGFVSACKWLVDLEVTRYDRARAYWTRRGWATDAPVKTAARIDVPTPLRSLSAGPVLVAGTAWAQHRGIDRVEVRVDGGRWQPARLATEQSVDTWRQWSYGWQATAGTHRIEARATDRTGAVQPEARARPFPSGATGWHSVVVTVA